MFNGYLLGEFVVDFNFQVIVFEFSLEMRDENGWYLLVIQQFIRSLEFLNK